MADTLATSDNYDIKVEGDAAIIDALTDLRHLCDKRGSDFADLDRIAHDHYTEELASEC